MGLSCSCDDYDDADGWMEPGHDSVPPSGTKCCECRAALPEGEPAQTILLFTPVDKPDADAPPHPDDALDDEPECSVLSRHWAQLYDAMELAREEYMDATGWDDEREQFIEQTAEYRCERCAGLATALDGSKKEGGLGFCMIYPGGLIEALQDYADMQGQKPRRWVRDAAGVLNPEKREVA